MTEAVMSTRELYELLKISQEEQTEKLMKEIQKVNEDTRKQLNKTEKNIVKLQDKYLDLERKRRKNNIVVFGLEIKNNILEETINKLNSLLEINLSHSDVNNIYTIGKQINKKGILIELISFLTKKSILKNAFKLKNTRVAIVNDYCLEDQEKQKILAKHLKIAKAQHQKPRIKGFKLEIEGKYYTTEQLETVEIGSQIDSDVLESDVEAEYEEEERGCTIEVKRKAGKELQENNNITKAKKTKETLYLEPKIATRYATKNIKK